MDTAKAAKWCQGGVTRTDGAKPVDLHAADPFADVLTPHRKAEQIKRDHHADLSPTYTRVAFVVGGTQGELGPEATEFVDVLAQQLARKRKVGQEPSASSVSRAKRTVTQRIVASEMATNARLLDNILMQSAPTGMERAVKCSHSCFAPQGAPTQEVDFWLAELAED